MAVSDPDKLGHVWGPSPPGTGEARICTRCGLGESNQYAKQRCKVTDFRPAKGVVSEYDPLSAA